jgi:hypothetical protein
MPLIKRKPVELVNPPRKDDYDEDLPVYYLKETGEIFPDYEDYIQRISFYRQPIFQCEVSGRIHLTFFEALKSERKQSALVHRSFPDALKGPILRSVQFYVTGRIDELVDIVFDRFRDRFFEDETVVLDIHGDRFLAAIRGIHPSRSLTKRREEDAALLAGAELELQRKATKSEEGKTETGADESDLSDVSMEERDNKPEVKLELKDIAHIIGTDLTKDEAEAQKDDHPIDDYLYSVQLLSADGEDDFSMARMERRADSLTRDRLSFSKTILKKYLKECVVRDASIGSPWVVKPLLAEKFGIPTSMSEDVEEKNRLIKEVKLSKRRKYLDEEGGEDSGAAKKPRKSKAEEAKAEAEHREEEERRRAEEKRRKMIKYPLEDLQLEVVNRELAQDHQGESTTDTLPEPKRPVPRTTLLPVSPTLFEPLMNSYLFLQACGKALSLSPFHLDEYESALRHTTHDPPCHLIGEAHAALLNVIVRDTSNAKLPSANAPKAVADDDDLEEDEFDEDNNLTEDEEAGEDIANESEEEEEEDELDELDSKASSIDDSETESVVDQTVDGEEVLARKGEEVYAAGRKLGRGWESKHLRADNFRAGWEYSICGLLTKRATQEEFPRSLAILSHLTGVGSYAKEDRVKAEGEDEGTIKAASEMDIYETPSHRYVTLALEDKILLLQYLCEQAVLTRSIKRFFDQCEHQLTELRKERVELGRARRKLAEDRAAFEDSLKKDSDGEEIGETEETAAEDEGTEATESATDTAASSKINGKQANGTKVKTNKPLKIDDGDLTGEEDELTSAGALNSDEEYDSDDRRKRNFGSRQEAMRIKAIQREALEAERNARLRQEREEQKARQLENRQIALDRKKLDDEEARIIRREEAIDREFRQHSQAPRLTPLGRDRFLDKYWWFDGVGSASLMGAHGVLQYSAGRLFVQGPSEEEWDALCEESPLPREELEAFRQAEYTADGVLGFNQWGAYTEPEEVDNLRVWLRTKGIREQALKREMDRFRAYLQPGMQKRNHDLSGGWKDNVETRRSNRTKDNAALRQPYMSYRNAFAKSV